MRNILITGLILAACSVGVPPIAHGSDNPAHNSCDATQYKHLIGQSADVLAAMTFPAPMRVIKFGMMITMDYSPDRLNLDLDANNRISRVWCG